MVKAKTYNPRKARPDTTRRWRGVTSALTKSAVPRELVNTQHNLVSTEIAQLKTRKGTDRTPISYDGTIHERYYGSEVEATAEGTRVHAGLLFPFATGPASRLVFNPEFPIFLPPSFPDPPDWDDYGVEIPDVPGLDFPPITDLPEQPPDPFPDYPGGGPPPNMPYGPNEPPGFTPPGPGPCGWTTNFITSKFRLDLTVTNWRLDRVTNHTVNSVVCVSIFCAPSAISCTNETAARAAAGIFAKQQVDNANATNGLQFNTIIGESSATCAALDWTLESDHTIELIEFAHNPLICGVAENPTGTPVSPNAMKYTDDLQRIDVIVDVIVQNYKPLLLATQMCRLHTMELVWENGYRKEIPINPEALQELDGEDLIVKDWNLGDIDVLKAGVGYPALTPCDLKSDGAFALCVQPQAIWDCGGAPPPPLTFTTT